MHSLHCEIFCYITDSDVVQLKELLFMAQILIVSNRLPVSVKKVDGQLEFYSSTGGVATGLASFIKGRHNKWIGWPGISSDELTEEDKRIITLELAKRHCVPVFLSKKQIDDFYSGFSNSLLWPLLHSLSYKDNPAHEQWWRSYRGVNKLYAEVVIDIAQASSTIWVQDYHLLLLPELLRPQLDIATTQIGFFLHVPFPKSRSFMKLAENKRLLKGLLGADLIGFHTKSYVKNFLDTCQQAGLGTATAGQLIIGNRTIHVTDFPMGIDYEKFAEAQKLPVVRQAIRRYRKKYKGLKVIAAVDRLDISKGFLERLTAYRDLLLQNPELQSKVVFALVGAPTRTEVEAYIQLTKRVAKLVSDINRQLGTPSWQPVDYIDKAIPFEEVTALFSVADVAFIAPLRDGMNLVAKEFVASNHDSGVLVLSETAGAADELRDALLVNPRQSASSVAALQEALAMPKRELRKRLKNMQQSVATNTVQSWGKTFVKTLQQPTLATPLHVKHLRGKSELTIQTDYAAAQSRLLLLDYDGSLTPLRGNYKLSKPSANLLDLLEKLSADKANTLVLISGREAQNLEDWFGYLPINLVAEHGAMTKKVGHKNWQTLEQAESRWKREVLPVLEHYAALTPEALVEVKPHSLVWHYRQSPAYYAQKYAVVIKRVLKPVLKAHSLEILQGSKILEIKNPTINKGSAVRRWLEQQQDFVMAIGDDYTDEDMFMAVPASAYTIKVGSGRTQAHYRLPDPKATVTFLKKLAR
jgi:trehalose 6-phosphate synthase/phosphatase